MPPHHIDNYGEKDNAQDNPPISVGSNLRHSLSPSASVLPRVTVVVAIAAPDDGYYEKQDRDHAQKNPNDRRMAEEDGGDQEDDWADYPERPGRLAGRNLAVLLPVYLP